MGTATVATVLDSGNVLIDSLAWGSAWTSGGGGATVIEVGYYPLVTSTESTPTAAELDAIARTLEIYERYINVDFQFVGQDLSGASDIRFVIANNPAVDYLGEAYPPGELADMTPSNPGYSEVIVYENNFAGRNGALGNGGYDFITFIHEFGHAMGLAHPHDDGGTPSDPSLIFPGVTEPFDSYGLYDLNQGVYTTMSYNDGWPVGGLRQLNAAFGFQFTPMALDILTLQYIYGANTTYAGGDDLYSLPLRSAAGAGYSSIWDTGGVDSIVAGGRKASVIDLRAATGNVEEGGGGFLSYVSGVRGGFTIAAGAVIENATGGGGADTIIGNDAANIITGGLRQDIMMGGGGGDTFVFIGLKDTRATAASADIILDFNAAEDVIDVSLLDANARLAGTQDFSFLDDTSAFTAAGQVISYASAGSTVIAFNTDMDARAEALIILAGLLDLADGNFII